MHLIKLLLIVAFCTYNVQGQARMFIGQFSSLYFAIMSSPGTWEWGMNYCHTYSLMPGSIPTEADHQMITNFLNTSDLIDDDNRFLWLAATDYEQEGRFQWMWNHEEVSVGTWAPGMPSINRTANCLAMNRFGQFIQEACFSTAPRANYYTLCQAPTFYQGQPPTPTTKWIENSNELTSSLELPIPLSLTEIGSVGNKTYFTDNETLMSWSECLDRCHQAGLRLATPELPDEMAFIQNYVSEQFQQPNPLYHIAGTNRLSMSTCLKTNSEFMWLFSGNPVANQTELNGDSSNYLCTFLDPTALRIAGCNVGQGPTGHPICEVSM